MSAAFSNTIGGTYDRASIIKGDLCPFCGVKLAGPFTNSACGFQGKAITSNTGQVVSVCKNTGPVVTKPATHNTLKPGDVIRAKYPKTPVQCPLCGCLTLSSNINAFSCGFSGIWLVDKVNVEVITPCSNYAPNAPAMGFIASTIDQKALAASLINKPTGEACSNKPRINCPKCGAYGADKHRIGCSTGGI